MEAGEQVSYGWMYLDPQWGWVSGGQDYISRGHRDSKAALYASSTGRQVRLSTMTTTTVIEDLPLPDQQ